MNELTDPYYLTMGLTLMIIILIIALIGAWSQLAGPLKQR